MKIKFVSVFLDHSGYAQASRNVLLALLSAGIEVQTKIVSFQSGNESTGAGAEEAKNREQKNIDYDIVLIMLTPEQAVLYKENDKYNIEILFWEVLGLDNRWVEHLKKFDEIWTPSKIFADTFLHNGVNKPIKVIKQPIEIKETTKKIKIKEWDKFLFYSIFQWTERKNPKALLKAYWEAFENNNDVALLLKTYRGDFSISERQIIKNDIKNWKIEQPQKHYPKVFLVLDELSKEEINKLHNRGDIFVSAHRGEGWGYPQMEAMAVGNPIISTNFGGIHEILSDKNSWLVDYEFNNVFGMNHIPWYNNNQLWAEISKEGLKKAMLEAYNNKKLKKSKSKSAIIFVRKNLSMSKVGQEFKNLLTEIKL